MTLYAMSVVRIHFKFKKETLILHLIKKTNNTKIYSDSVVSFTVLNVRKLRTKGSFILLYFTLIFKKERKKKRNYFTDYLNFYNERCRKKRSELM